MGPQYFGLSQHLPFGVVLLMDLVAQLRHHFAMLVLCEVSEKGEPRASQQITVSDDFEGLAASAKVNRSLTPESPYFGGF